ncbi:hypothetical protein scyTo_0027212 [Scyliorhinus torazame]|uniref:Uncharacterized protein n=1 Tax=Scyliorhinus torazame TaxID=75743 RepID=A0A401QMC5_SCYTO|nr:hypothetical protein [Scyliorhinus torazame]
MEAQLKALTDEMLIILSGCHGEVLLQKAMADKAETLSRYLEYETSARQMLAEIQQSREKVALKVIEVEEEQNKKISGGAED